MKIKEVSQLLDIPSPTLRYYEEIHLINSVPRVSGQRDYSPEHIEQLKFIQCMKNTGMSLGEIALYRQLYLENSDEADRKRLKLIENQQKIVQQQLQQLQESLEYLQYKTSVIQQEIQKRHKNSTSH